eukprot:7064340-Ditylum_brightwellii.AAC.1
MSWNRCMGIVLESNLGIGVLCGRCAGLGQGKGQSVAGSRTSKCIVPQVVYNWGPLRLHLTA